ncbi:orotate phosphoribosyltransferase [Amylibacter marinus]|uniref:Orotate phosphoribosyltransferase n=1 Tax=Amylibacter marinus TaxID=1475483 RepID=A0ABQ5VS41_9RHOB|nr:orotate phosphoribosyltransferase [Amylibacter marinus]GLQ33964.1 orotate phosphoribosyltransferase [Amylibacter marinus]
MSFPNTFASKEEMAKLAAQMFLEIEAVKFRPEEPYTFASGLASPVYIDCRKLISHPRIRSALMDFAVATLYRDAGFEKFDSAAGGETAGIPFAAWIADKMALPMQYVRKKPKGYGRDAQIEGDIHPGQRVLLVEDLTTDGGSKLMFAEAIRRAEAICEDILVIFYYDIFKNTHEMLAQNGLRLHYLLTWWDILAAARAGGNFDAAQLDQVEAFLNNPLEWSAANGGISELPVSKA